MPLGDANSSTSVGAWSCGHEPANSRRPVADDEVEWREERLGWFGARCVLQGFPGVSQANGPSDDPVGEPAVRDEGPQAPEPAPVTLVAALGQPDLPEPAAHARRPRDHAAVGAAPEHFATA